MTTSSKKVLVVFGATGAQGGGVARAALADASSGYTVRAVTRDPNSEASKKLREAGAELVTADLDDAASVERAMEGADAAFLVTFFWAHMSPEKELAQAQTLAKAAKKAGVKHAVWSTLEDTRKYVPLSDNRMPTLGGNYKVPHFDAKGMADNVFRELGVPTTFLVTSFYWENFIGFGMEPKRYDGKLVLGLPMGESKLAGIASEDIGKAAYAILKDPSTIGKTIGVAGDHLTGQEIAKAFERAYGEPVHYAPMTHAAFRALGFPGADDLGNMFQVYTEFAKELGATRDLARAKALVPTMESFDAWLARNASRIPRH